LNGGSQDEDRRHHRFDDPSQLLAAAHLRMVGVVDVVEHAHRMSDVGVVDRKRNAGAVPEANNSANPPNRFPPPPGHVAEGRGR
jgi:hypothetical protein